MALAQHSDYRLRFSQQTDNARSHVMPFIEKVSGINADMQILEIGCGEGGVLVPFLEKGCHAVGIELDEAKSIYAKELLDDYIQKGQLEIVNRNIYDEEALTAYKNKFDLILLKDVIEHIPRQEIFIPYLNEFLKPGGLVFFGFPPWYMPHGGHQQACDNKFLSVLPWFHLLPTSVYKKVLKAFGETEGVIKEMLEIKETGISIERFEKIAVSSGYSIVNKTHYLINPIYEQKFGLKAFKQLPVIRSIPFIRNFVTTCVYYLIKRN
jgi:SAM-dependent methyltransferase